MKLADLVALIAFHFRNLLSEGRTPELSWMWVRGTDRTGMQPTWWICSLKGMHSVGKRCVRTGEPSSRLMLKPCLLRTKPSFLSGASHVLEHTTDPARACNELMRVAHAGYIETPSPFYEQGYNYPNPKRGWPFHNWYVWLKNDDTLVFEPKTAGEHRYIL